MNERSIIYKNMNERFDTHSKHERALHEIRTANMHERFDAYSKHE